MTSKNWDKVKLAVNIYYPRPSSDVTAAITQATVLVGTPCPLVNRVSIKTSFKFEPYHGLTEWNQGVIEKPPEFTFTVAFPATSNIVRLMRALHAGGIPFNLEVKDTQVYGKDGLGDPVPKEFALITEALMECRCTSKEVSITVGNIPMVVFQGMALRYTYSDPVSDKTDMEGDGATTEIDSLFGSGGAIAPKVFEEWN